MTQESVVVWCEEAIGRIIACEEVRDLQLAGTRPLYAARRGGEWVVVLGEDAEGAYDEVSDLAFDGRWPLFRAVGDRGECVVFGGHEGRTYDKVKELYLFEGEPFYVAARGSSVFTVHGSEEGPRFVSEVALFREKHELLIKVRTESEAALHGERTEPTRGREPILGQLLQTLDHSFFTEERGGKLFVAWGEGEQMIFDEVSDLVGAGDKPLYRARRGAQEMVVWGSEVSKSYNQTFSLHVEGDHIVFGARSGKDLIRVSRRIV